MDQKYAHLPVVAENDVNLAKDYGETGVVPAELLPQLLTETGFHWVEKAPYATSYEMGEGIGLRKIPCPWCGWQPTDRAAARRILLAAEGDTTGVQVLRHHPCRCHYYEKVFTRWSGPQAMIPHGYRQFRLRSLEPSRKSRVSLTDQALIIATMRDDPTLNYLFIGPGGTGKTVFTTALFAWALDNWAEKVWGRLGMVDAVWRVITSDYLQQEHDYIRERERKIVDADGNVSYAPAKEPIVTRQKVREARSAGLVPRLFLEEIDKIPDLTAFRSSNLFALINEVYEQEGQIVVSSNKNVTELKKLFGEDNGVPLVRRFTKDNQGLTFDLYDFELRPE